MHIFKRAFLSVSFYSMRNCILKRASVEAPQWNSVVYFTWYLEKPLLNKTDLTKFLWNDNLKNCRSLQDDLHARWKNKIKEAYANTQYRRRLSHSSHTLLRYIYYGVMAFTAFSFRWQGKRSPVPGTVNDVWLVATKKNHCSRVLTSNATCSRICYHDAMILWYT